MLEVPGKSKIEKLSSIRKELTNVVIFVAAIWIVFILDAFLPLKEWFPLVPRSFLGLIGIFTSPFLHGDIWHILANTLPLIVLLSLLVGSRNRSWEVVLAIILVGGGVLWLFGNPIQFVQGMFGYIVGFFRQSGTDPVEVTIRAHIGASLLIFGLITFLITAGFLEKRFVPMAVAMFVMFMYGFTLLFGIVPKFNSNESWDGHLSGAVGGVLVAFLMHWNANVKTSGKKSKGGAGSFPEL